MGRMRPADLAPRADSAGRRAVLAATRVDSAGRVRTAPARRIPRMATPGTRPAPYLPAVRLPAVHLPAVRRLAVHQVLAATRIRLGHLLPGRPPQIPIPAPASTGRLLAVDRY